MTKHRRLSWSALPLSFLLALPVPVFGQRAAQKKTSAPANEKTAPKVGETGLAESELPAFAVSLVIALASEARSYSDVALRPRVLARAADVLWDADNVNARALFKRAWEEAEKGDADELTVKTKDNPPAMVTAMRRMSGRDLRFEVLSVIARRDRALAEEFYAKVTTANEERTSANKEAAYDSWVVPDAVSKRLQVATALLKDGQIEKALEFATPVLNQMNAQTITFLSELRTKNAEAADRTFAMLLTRVEFDPQSDANTVSGLSSYLFTPGFYVTFNPEGGMRWIQPDEQPTTPPTNLPPALRDKFFQVASTILLRPISPRQESGSFQRNAKASVINRLLPLFDQYAPDSAAALRANLSELTSSSSRDVTASENFFLTQGIRQEPSVEDALEQMQSRIDRAKNTRERDSIYAATAFTLVTKGDERARDLADKIEDAERRTEVRQNVDFDLVQRAIGRKAASEALRLVHTGKLSNTQRAAAYIDVARILRDTERQRALELLEEAVREVNRIEGKKPDRAVLLVGIANQFMGADRVRAWEIIGDAVKEANGFEGFTGENTVTFPLMTRGGVKFLNIGGENFSLAHVFRALAKDDLYRAVDLAKTLKYDAPRANVTLAIASSILQPK